MKWRIENQRMLGRKPEAKVIIELDGDELEHLAKCAEDNDEFNGGAGLHPEITTELNAARVGLLRTEAEARRAARR